jgi:hypothetical protein
MAMKSLSCISLVLAVSAVLLTSCEPFDKVSSTPEIHFKSYTPYLADTLGFTIEAGELIFSFQDGNANFGTDTITFPDINKDNLILLPYSKINGEYDSIDAETYGRKYSIAQNERLNRTGQNKTIRGEIKLQIYYFLTPPYDTIRYDFFIIDRDGNKSNVESTTDIAF